jgi:hypothetical protein
VLSAVRSGAAAVAEALPAGEGDLNLLAPGSSVDGDGARRELIGGVDVDEEVDGTCVDFGAGVTGSAGLEDLPKVVKGIGKEL